MKKIIVLTGAGMSAESGIKTFRDSGGLWEEHRVEDVATFVAWQRNQEMVLRFYNERRRQLATVEPNQGHKSLVKLEEKFDVQIITQNVDNLHERAGSSKVLHLHGELTKARSTMDENYVVDIGYSDISPGDICPKGAQLRPHIVWFGESVPNIIPASEMIEKADIIIVIGTSLNVYPAAGLLHYAPFNVPKYLIDPIASNASGVQHLKIIKEKAGTGVPTLVEQLLLKDHN